jgi:hypothetical protein
MKSKTLKPHSPLRRAGYFVLTLEKEMDKNKYIETSWQTGKLIRGYINL